MNTELNPYEPVDDAESHDSVGGLTCPYCSHVFPLTRKIYYLEPTSTHRCPACTRKSKLASDKRYWARLVATTSIQVVGTMILVAPTIYFVGMRATLVVAVVCLVLGFEYDRWCDSRRRLEPIEDTMK